MLIQYEYGDNNQASTHIGFFHLEKKLWIADLETPSCFLSLKLSMPGELIRKNDM